MCTGLSHVVIFILCVYMTLSRAVTIVTHLLSVFLAIWLPQFQTFFLLNGGDDSLADGECFWFADDFSALITDLLGYWIMTKLCFKTVTCLFARIIAACHFL